MILVLIQLSYPCKIQAQRQGFKWTTTGEKRAHIELRTHTYTQVGASGRFLLLHPPPFPICWCVMSDIWVEIGLIMADQTRCVFFPFWSKSTVGYRSITFRYHFLSILKDVDETLSLVRMTTRWNLPIHYVNKHIQRTVRVKGRNTTFEFQNDKK